jgi:hypothetical protein
MNKNQIHIQALLTAILLVGLVACTNSPGEEADQLASPTQTALPTATHTIAPTRIELPTITHTTTPIPSPTPVPPSMNNPVLLGDYAIISSEEMQSDLDELWVHLPNCEC